MVAILLSAHALAESDALSPVGAILAGNAETGIPAYTDTPLRAPEGWQSGEHYRNPFPQDQMVTSIDASNMATHAKYLSAGQQALLTHVPGRALRIYPTRRSSHFPATIIAATKANRASTQLSANGNALIGYREGFPFPQLATDMPERAALQAMWNHLTRYRGGSFERTIMHTTVLESGDFVPVRLNQRYQRALTAASEPDQNILFYHLDRVIAPPKLAGATLLVHETIDQVQEPRLTWLYNTSERRVRRLPEATYDSPVPGTNGIKTADAHDLFNGAKDRYDWHYEGRQILYVPYNAYGLADPTLSYEDILKPGGVNPALMRWELHRVHKIVAQRKADAEHILARRVFYIDEDSWTVVLSDSFDEAGNLVSTAEGHLLQFYDQNFPFYIMESIYDLNSARYVVFGLYNEEPRTYDFNKQFSRGDFTPGALRRGARG